MLRVLVAATGADERARMREALEPSRIVVCAEVGDAPAAVAAALRERPDVCLMEVDMPGGGIAAAAEIVARLPGSKIVMVARDHCDGDFFAALRAGASGFLLDDFDAARLPQVVSGVADGEAALPRPLVAVLMHEFREQGSRRRQLLLPIPGELTSREWQVLELLRSGLTTAEIADRLSITNGTVRSHVAAIVRKLGVRDRACAVRLAASRREVGGATDVETSQRRRP